MSSLRDAPSQERVLELLPTMWLIREFEDAAGQALAAAMFVDRYINVLVIKSLDSN